MIKTTFISLLLISSFSFGQKSDIESLINQISEAEVPENFEYFFFSF